MLSYLLAALESEEDKRRFTELYEENHVRAEQTALRILRDPHDAEDAVQNAFLQVIHQWSCSTLRINDSKMPVSA